ncbi:TauD/TfdA family dioxygenase, partial [Streptomyces sp. UNOC14_S4]|uniref:TauD/TfdA family dioxygenase n=1 Tax=Streptomyces sp. UNOC14_S4 TaxID=2872340 RepID=UPI001E57BEBC
LESGRTHPAPAPAPLRGRATEPEATAAAALAERLDPYGFAVTDLDRPMDNAEFLTFGRVLGTARPELSPDVRARVEDRVILNLRSGAALTDDPAVQPFAANALTLHSESSGAPVRAQPRHIVLMCVSPGDDGRCAQTVVVPMAGVHAALPAPVRDVLARLRYDRPGEVPTILRQEAGRPVFCVRDFLGAPLAWSYDGPSGTAPAAVDNALRALYAAMYGGEARGLTWTRGRVVVIDNTRHFHGRTRTSGAAAGTVARHLKRLRIGS